MESQHSLTTQHIVQFAPDKANATTYVIATEFGVGIYTGEILTIWAKYDDALKTVEDGSWKIFYRNVTYMVCCSRNFLVHCSLIVLCRARSSAMLLSQILNSLTCKVLFGRIYTIPILLPMGRIENTGAMKIERSAPHLWRPCARLNSHLVLHNASHASHAVRFTYYLEQEKKKSLTTANKLSLEKLEQATTGSHRLAFTVS